MTAREGRKEVHDNKLVDSITSAKLFKFRLKLPSIKSFQMFKIVVFHSTTSARGA